MIRFGYMRTLLISDRELIGQTDQSTTILVCKAQFNNKPKSPISNFAMHTFDSLLFTQHHENQCSKFACICDVHSGSFPPSRSRYATRKIRKFFGTFQLLFLTQHFFLQQAKQRRSSPQHFPQQVCSYKRAIQNNNSNITDNNTNTWHENKSIVAVC